MEKYGSCDTFVVLPSHTERGSVIFGKNSDRPATEIQDIVFCAAQNYPPKSTLKCTYIEIQQVERTRAVVLSKPNWMWGAEMGANEDGVCIGNEAVFTILASPDDIQPKLLGMDLLRLGLERAGTALDALHVITGLLEQYGQGGPCSDTMTDFVYHNSFIICDPKEAWVLETAGQFWVAEHVTEGYRNISNCFSVGTKIDLMSNGLKETAKELGLWDGVKKFNFANVFSSDINPGCDRYVNGQGLLKELTSERRFTALEMFQILRDEESYICRNDGDFITTSSQVSVLSAAGSKCPSVHWFTGTPNPKMSVFKPFVFTGCRKFTPLLTSPEDGRRSIERKHPIYALRETAMQLRPQTFQTLSKLESNCYKEMEDFVAKMENGSATLSELDGLFNDCAETEAKFYAVKNSLSFEVQSDNFFTLAGPIESKTDGQRGQGVASRSLGGRDSPRSLSASTARRWIPPSSCKRDASTHDNKNDTVFRKVRGILNKLTPEKFQKLSDDLLGVGLDSPTILKGVILLIFEKALDEPKYSSMYAQLCKRLSEEAPNFEPVNSSQNNINTFRQLLLGKCRVEFENRSAAQEVFDSRDGPLTNEEEEQRQMAKRKMLGNIKFIGELGKLGMLQGSILHMCCQQLLERKRRGGIREMAEDLECLCQIMKTCGRILDTDKAKRLMDQYFDRMATLAYNLELPSRIRFMLQDAIDLRRNQWQPRKIASSDGPRTIQQIREEAARDIGVYFPQPGSAGSRGQDILGQELKQGLWAGGRPEMGTGFEDMFSSVPLSAVSIGTGPGVIRSMQDGFGYDSDSSLSFGMNYSGGQQSYRGRHSYGGASNGHYSNRPNGGPNNKQFSAQNQHQQSLNLTNNAKNDLPPRFKKMMLSQQRSQTSTEEVSLRPSANSMVLKPKAAAVSKPVTEPNAGPLGPFLDAPFFPVPKPAQGVTAVVEKPRSSKSKGPTKDEVLKKAELLLEELISSANIAQTVQAFKDSKLPDRFWPEVLSQLMKKVLDRGDAERELVSTLLTSLKKDGCISASHALESVKEVLQQLSQLEADTPRAKSYVAGFAARAIKDELMSLAEVAVPLEGGHHFPLFLLTLQQLHKLVGKAPLTQLFNESKVNLLSMLPELDRNKDRLAEILEDRGLSFLFPLLRIQADLWKQLQADPTPAQFYKWIKENLDSSYYTVPGFISALCTVLLKYIVQETVGDAATGEISASAAAAPDKAALEKEKELLKRYRSVLQAFLHDQVKLQVTALYALQAFCDGLCWPKGMLLRWFVLLYDQEIIEEEAFLKWKEDLSDDTPGKGKALFQVHNWLTWLEQADSDEEEDGDA